MLPIEHQGVPELSDHLLKLCTDALQLVLDLRKCKDLYRCEILATGGSVDEDKVEPQAAEKAEGPQIDRPRLEVILFGTLAKYPAMTPNVRLVLEKAHVVIIQGEYE